MDLEPLNGPTYEIKLAPPAAAGSSDILIALVVLNILLLGAFVVFTIVQNGRASGHPAFARILWRRIIALTATGCVAAYFFWSVRSILTPFLIAFFLAALLDPVVTNLHRRGRSRAWTVGAIFALVFLTIILSAILLARYAVPQMQDLAKNIPAYTHTIDSRGTQLYIQYQKPLAAIGIKANPISDRTGPLATGVTRVLENLKSMLLGLVGEALWLIIIPLSLFFFLLEFQHIRAKLISFVPDQYQANVDRMSQEVVDIFSQYIRGLAKVCVMYGITATLLFAVFRLNYFIFLGLAAGVLYAVPYVGPALAMASAGVLAFSMSQSPVYAVAVVGCFAAMHVLFDYVVTPRVVGGSVGLHPLVNVFALMCGATLFGVWGMLLAVPVAASIQMILFYFFPKLAEKPVLHSPYASLNDDVSTIAVSGIESENAAGATVQS